MVDGFQFWLQASSSEITTCNTISGNFLSLSNKESVIVSPVISVNTLNKKTEIKTVLVLERLSCSLVLWRSLKWLNGWGKENNFDVDCKDCCKQK